MHGWCCFTLLCSNLRIYVIAFHIIGLDNKLFFPYLKYFLPLQVFFLFKYPLTFRPEFHSIPLLHNEWEIFILYFCFPKSVSYHLQTIWLFKLAYDIWVGQFQLQFQMHINAWNKNSDWNISSLRAELNILWYILGKKKLVGQKCPPIHDCFFPQKRDCHSCGSIFEYFRISLSFFGWFDIIFVFIFHVLQILLWSPWLLFTKHDCESESIQC